MPLDKKFHSPHLAALQAEIQLKVRTGELSQIYSNITNGILEALNRGIVLVDDLRSPGYNKVLDPKKNFYGLKLNTCHGDSFQLLKSSPVIMKTLNMSRDSMSKKYLWGVFLTTILLELTKDIENVPSRMHIGSDQMFGNHKADFVVYGFKEAPRLIVEVNEELAVINPKKMQEMMTSALVSNYNDHLRWPLPELRHLSVYGLIVCENDFRIYRMSINAEKGTKLALLLTSDKKPLPFNLFKYKMTIDLNDLDSCLYESDLAEAFYKHAVLTDYSEDDNPFTYSTDEELCDEFEVLSIKNGKVGTVSDDSESEDNKAAPKDKIIFKGPNKGSVAAVIGLMQSILEQDEVVKSKNKKFKKRKKRTDLIA